MKEAARFEDLEQLQDRPDLLRGLYAEGLEAPSTLQRTLLPVLLGTGGRAQPLNNVVVHCTMHGTGKSTALALALLAQVDAGNPGTQPALRRLTGAGLVRCVLRGVRADEANLCARVCVCACVRTTQCVSVP